MLSLAAHVQRSPGTRYDGTNCDEDLWYKAPPQMTNNAGTYSPDELSLHVLTGDLESCTADCRSGWQQASAKRVMTVTVAASVNGMRNLADMRPPRFGRAVPAIVAGDEGDELRSHAWMTCRPH